MTDKEVKKLKRLELLEMLIEQTEENEKLKKQIADLEEQLSQRRIKLEKAGSIAEAAVNLSSVFSEAQTAADQYLDSIRKQHEETEAACAEKLRQTEQQCRTMEEEARKRGEQIAADGEQAIAREREKLRNEWKQRRQELELEFENKLSQAISEARGDIPQTKHRSWFFGK